MNPTRILTKSHLYYAATQGHKTDIHVERAQYSTVVRV